MQPYFVKRQCVHFVQRYEGVFVRLGPEGSCSQYVSKEVHTLSDGHIWMRNAVESKNYLH
jgi:hypothetical protein